jgi:CDP-diacylglycerol--glycerol-3-phosphate 3-phosphatidyltransferase
MGPLKRNLPNFLSALRLVLIIPFMVAIRRDDNLVIIVSAVSIVLTDYLDGKLARAWNIVSSTGKILDPLADKICTGLAALSLVYFRGFPLWLMIVIIARDIGILLAGLILLRLRHIVPASNIVGKISMVTVALCLMVYLFDIKAIMPGMIIITVLALAVSVVSYSALFLRMIWRKVA